MKTQTNCSICNCQAVNFGETPRKVDSRVFCSKCADYVLKQYGDITAEGLRSLLIRAYRKWTYGSAEHCIRDFLFSLGDVSLINSVCITLEKELLEADESVRVANATYDKLKQAHQIAWEKYGELSAKIERDKEKKVRPMKDAK